VFFCVKGKRVGLLHYWDLKLAPKVGIDPTTSCASNRRSTTELLGGNEIGPTVMGHRLLGHRKISRRVKRNVGAIDVFRAKLG
jgi:hypothetical protein